LKRTLKTTLIWVIEHPNIVVLIPPLILFLPIMIRGEALFWGTPILQFIPWRYLALETFLNGELPLWNPYSGMGSPLLANYQTAVFYPPNWLVFILGGMGGVTWLAWGHTIVVIFHLWMAGWGMIKLSRNLGLSKIGQSICGLSFSLSAYFVARSGFFTINAAVTWLPWIAYLTLPRGNRQDNHLIDSQTIKLALVFALLFLAGHAQTTFYIILFSTTWVIFWLLTTQEKNANKHDFPLITNYPIYQKFRPLIHFLTGGIIGFFFASIQLIPTFEYLINSQRAENIDSMTAITYSFWPWRFLTLFAPDMFGSPAQNNYWGFGNYWEDALYIGMLPLILFFIAIINMGIRNRKNAKQDSMTSKSNKLYWFLFGVMVISILIALGKNTPLFPFLYRHFPMFNMFQAPTRINLLVVFSMSLLGGFGIDQWTQPTGKRLYWTRLSVAGALALAIGAGLAWILLRDIQSTFISAFTKAGFLAAASIALILYKPEMPKRIEKSYSQFDDGGEEFSTKLWNFAIIIFVSLDLVWANWNINPTYKVSLYKPETNLLAGINEKRMGGRLFLNSEDEYQLKYNEFFRFKAFKSMKQWKDLWSVMLPNINILAHIPSANQFDPLIPSRYKTWSDLLNNQIKMDDKVVANLLLNLSNITLVEELNPDHRIGMDYVTRSTFDRIRWVPCGVQADNNEISLEDLLANDVNFSDHVVIETEISKEVINCVDKNYKIELVSEKANYLQVKVDTPTPGYLVVSDTWYPGWKSYINGKYQKVEKANYLFRAVRLDAGVNEIKFVYQPLSFYLGASISFLSILFLILHFFLGRNEHGIKKQA
jgi:hypothetical protein